MPTPLDYQPHDEDERPRMGPSDWAGWIAAAFIVLMLLSCAGLALK